MKEGQTKLATCLGERRPMIEPHAGACVGESSGSGALSAYRRKSTSRNTFGFRLQKVANWAAVSISSIFSISRILTKVSELSYIFPVQASRLTSMSGSNSLTVGISDGFGFDAPAPNRKQTLVFSGSMSPTPGSIGDIF